MEEWLKTKLQNSEGEKRRKLKENEKKRIFQDGYERKLVWKQVNEKRKEAKGNVFFTFSRVDTAFEIMPFVQAPKNIG